MYYHFLHQHFHRFLYQHLSLSPALITGSSEDLLSDALISLDANYSPSPSCEGSSLLPYVSLFEGTSSDLEPNEDERHVMGVWSPDRSVHQDSLVKVSLSGAPYLNSRSRSPDLFSEQEQPMCEYGGVITDDDFDIETDFDVEV